MITQLKIENYKSIQELTLDVGRVNVLIGENGCGKSNILEAITLAAAAEANKLDNLAARGVRVTEPKLMRSSFDKNYQEDPIKITITSQSLEQVYTLINNNETYSKWLRLESNLYSDFTELKKKSELLIKHQNNIAVGRKNTKKYAREKEEIDKLQKEILEKILDGESKILPPIFKNDFVIYSPDEDVLRQLKDVYAIEPVGRKGDGLLNLLIHTQHEAKESQQEFTELTDIKESLELFGWYEAIEIPNDFSPLERSIIIKDRYLEIPFDQYSVNEGFLLVLFYITLVVSKHTPKIFAIDNMDTSLNPKLCTKLIEVLIQLADKYKKQIFITTHNPAVLDGIDLSDVEQQRLFVVSRNKQGHTRCKRIELKDSPKSSIRDRLSRVFTEDKLYSREEILNAFDNSDEPLNLSYALLRGYLGGLPKNF